MFASPQKPFQNGSLKAMYLKSGIFNLTSFDNEEVKALLLLNNSWAYPSIKSLTNLWG